MLNHCCPLYVCPDQPDDQFILMIEAKRGSFCQKTKVKHLSVLVIRFILGPFTVQNVKLFAGTSVHFDKSEASHLDSYAPFSIGDKVYTRTIHCSNCEVLVRRGKCSPCVWYRDLLWKIYHRWQKQQKSCFFSQGIYQKSCKLFC